TAKRWRTWSESTGPRAHRTAGTRTAGTRAARATVLAGARFADRQRPSVEHLAVEFLNGLFRVRPLLKLDECEPARPPRLAVNRKHHLRGGRDGSEVGTQVGLRRAVRKITDEQTDSQSLAP